MSVETTRVGDLHNFRRTAQKLDGGRYQRWGLRPGKRRKVGGTGLSKNEGSSRLRGNSMNPFLRGEEGGRSWPLVVWGGD